MKYLVTVLLILCLVPVMGAERNRPSELNGVGTGASHRFLASHILGIGIPLVYEFQVSDGDYVVVAGFCEPYWNEGGNRVMDLTVSGGETVRLDPAAEPGKGKAVFCEARGRGTEGRLRVRIGAAESSPDQNTICSGLWVFDSGTYLKNSLSPDAVERGEGDEAAIYIVNCGERDSDIVYRDFEKDMQRIRALGRVAPGLGIPFSAKGSEAAYAVKDISLLKTLCREAAPVFARAEQALYNKYSSFMSQSAETRLFSPGQANIEIRQENRIKVSLKAYPGEDSGDYEFHWDGAGARIEDALSLSFSGPGHDEGKALELKTDPALLDIDYTAARVKYVYSDTTLSFNVCDKPWLLVSSSQKPFDIETSLEEKNGAFRGRKGSMFFALVSPEGRRSRMAALCWADSDGKLDKIIRSLGSLDQRRAEAEEWADRSAENLRLTGAGAYDALMNQNHRAMATMHWPQGQLLAALDGGYTSIWVRDTTMGVLFEALAGEHKYIDKWAEYLINNYSEDTVGGKTYKTFFTFPGKRHFKKEQDGHFYAVASCYGAWKLAGNKSRLQARYEVLQSSADYHRARWFDTEKQLYMETYVNETTMGVTEEYKTMGERYESLVIDGQYADWIDSLYQNQIMYASHIMLAEMADALGKQEDRDIHLRRALDLKSAVKKELWDGEKYYSGVARLPDGTYRKTDWFYHDIFFNYVWALTLFPAVADHREGYMSLEAIMTRREPGALFGGTLHRNYFAGGWGHASYAFAMAGEYEKARLLLDRISAPMRKVYYNGVMDAVYYMPDVMYENANGPGGHRPQSFAIGPWMYAAAAFCAIEDYNGITAVPSGTGEEIAGMSFRGAQVTVRTGKAGQYPKGIRVNGRLLEGILKAPARLIRGKTLIEVVYDNTPYALPVVAYTNAEAGSVRNINTGTAVSLSGFGRIIVRFDREVSEENLSLRTPKGEPVGFDVWTEGGKTRMEYDSAGEILTLNIKG
ncbi:MAG: hypothetical protein IJT95_04420 [Abditibacteriota bacterium]|nr:hypothetical protein [Abditibacteriota bacterium]